MVKLAVPKEGGVDVEKTPGSLSPNGLLSSLALKKSSKDTLVVKVGLVYVGALPDISALETLATVIAPTAEVDASALEASLYDKVANDGAPGADTEILKSLNVIALGTADLACVIGDVAVELTSAATSSNSSCANNIISSTLSSSAFIASQAVSNSPLLSVCDAISAASVLANAISDNEASMLSFVAVNAVVIVELEVSLPNTFCKAFTDAYNGTKYSASSGNLVMELSP